MTKMRAQILEGYSESPEFVSRNDFELNDQDLKEREVLVRIKAASLNAGDGHMSSGAVKLLFPKEFPLILGLDGSGIVEKVGSLVTKFQVGDEVVGSLPGAKTGTLAELCKFEEDDLILKPKEMTDLQAAAFPTIGGTIFTAYTHHPKIDALIKECMEKPELLNSSEKPKKQFKLLIIGAAGGCGSMAVLMASKFLKRILDLTIYAVCSEKNIEYVKSLGADEIIDYTKTSAKDGNNEYHSSSTSGLPSVCQVLRRDFGEEYVDMVIDCVGGYYFYDDVKQHLDCRKAEDQVVYACLVPPGAAALNFSTICSTAYYMITTICSALISKGSPKYGLVNFFGKKPKEFAFLMHNILTPDNNFSLMNLSVFQLDEATQAMQMMKSKKTVGKIVVNI